MEPELIRNIPALTQEECALLGRSRVLVVGCGGLGGYLAEFLVRIGVGHIRFCDGDAFEATNLNRQLLSEPGLLGMNKARAAARRASRIRPRMSVEAVEEPMTEKNVAELVRDCDAVLDGLDNVRSRKLLCAACSQAGVPYIFGAVEGWVAQAAVSLPGDNLVQTLFPEEDAAENASVLSFTPALCAAVQTALCVKLLTGRPVEGGKVFCFDLFHQEFETISL